MTEIVAGGVESSTGDVVDADVIEKLMEKADAEGLELVGPGGVLGQLTERVLETVLHTEMTHHLGYEKGDPAGVGTPNSRNGTGRRTVLTGVGAVDIDVPWDRDGSFEPQIVAKRQRRLDGFNEQIVSLYARGMSVRDIRAHLAEIYGIDVSPDLVSKVTDAVTEELTTWQNRPLDPVWPIVHIDALTVKVRDGVVSNRPVHLAVGVDLDGRTHVLGMWLGKDGEGAKFWLSVLTEPRNRGIADVCVACCDGLKGLPEAITTTWPKATVQTCVAHVIRASPRYTSKKHHTQLVAGLKPIYTATTEQAAEAAFRDVADSDTGRRHPAIVRV